MMLHRVDWLEVGDWDAAVKDAFIYFMTGRVVCHDYGSSLLLNHGAFTGLPKKQVEWWD